ncbi:MAG: putative sulfate exporter family transporter [Chloroflexi bacterium HGW-Chloroflexi-6]|nr:MAG: putative sulfate exporter family transporter [Chloroflexi bacterium HGW-Chloroflexi-6]
MAPVNKHATFSQPSQLPGFFAGLAIVLLLAWLAWQVTTRVYTIQLPFGIPGKALEYPLWAAALGVVGNFLLKTFKIHEYVRPGIRSELFLKIGLILLGASISFTTLAAAAGGAVLQGVIMITSVFFFAWWLGGKFHLDDKLRAVMATALAVCGVSAAIAAAGSVVAKKEQVAYVTTLIILFALPLMVIAPLLASWLGLPQDVAGAWFGGNIDTTAAVVGAGTIYGEEAQTVASIIKATQNAFIGLVTFFLALYFVVVVERKPDERPSISLVWQRFPKFVLGFVLASVLYTLGWIDGGKGTVIEAIKNWSFLLAFVCMGLEISTGQLKEMGWSPVIVFLLVTLFNTALALAVAWVIFGILWPLG